MFSSSSLSPSEVVGDTPEPFLLSRRTLRCGLIEKGLEDECGCHLINNAAMLLAGMAGLVKDLVSFVGRQAFVPKVDGKAGKLT